MTQQDLLETRFYPDGRKFDEKYRYSFSQSIFQLITIHSSQWIGKEFLFYLFINTWLLGRHQFLDSLVFLQQESSHNSSLDASCTYSTSINSANSPLSLLTVCVLGSGHLLDSINAALAVCTFGRFCLFRNNLWYKTSTWCLNGYGATALGSVMSSDDGDSLIRHGEVLTLTWLLESGETKNKEECELDVLSAIRVDWSNHSWPFESLFLLLRRMQDTQIIPSWEYLLSLHLLFVLPSKWEMGSFAKMCWW